MSQVTCTACQTAVDLSKADITGRGYRCTACSLKASLASDGGHNDVADHLTGVERAQRAKLASSEIVGGVALAVGGAVCTVVFSGLIGVVVCFAGLGAVSHGLLTRREMTGQRTY